MILPEKRLVRPDPCIVPTEIVEESEVVIDLHNNGGNGESQSDKIDDANPFTGAWFEEGLWIAEERPNFHPGDVIVDDPGAI